MLMVSPNIVGNEQETNRGPMSANTPDRVTNDYRHFDQAAINSRYEFGFGLCQKVCTS